MSGLINYILGTKEVATTLSQIEYEKNSHQLISFNEDDKAIISEKNIWHKQDINNKSYKVITIIGDARKGKSTLMNCIVSNILKMDMEIFKSSSQSETLTHGITMYVINDYILFDCEGLGKEGAERDVRLLLIPYLISNIIIMNDSDDFNDSLIKKLEPLTTLSKFINIEEIIQRKIKPELVFRIRNYDLDGDIKDTFNKKIENCKKSRKKNDFSKTIINTLEQLFNKMHIFSTPNLDRSDMKLLKEKSFLKLLENEENKFNEIINNILEIGDKVEKIKYYQLIDGIKKAINQMNTNEKISAEIFDTTVLKHVKEILEFITMIKIVYKSLFEELIVDGTKKNNIIIEERIKGLNDLITKFKEQFKTVEPEIKDKYLKEEIINKIQPKIDNAINNSKRIVKEYYDRKLKIEIENELKNIIRNINNSNYHKMEFINTNIKQKTLIDIINKLDIYTYGDEIKLEVMNKINKINDSINGILKEQEKKKIETIESIKRVIISYDDKYVKRYINMNKNDDNEMEVIIERMNEEIKRNKFTYITFTEINIDGVKYVINELIEMIEYNNYKKYIEEYEKKMKEEINEIISRLHEKDPKYKKIRDLLSIIR